MYRVMVVDDEPFVRTAIRSLCAWSEHGYSIDLEARNGAQALQLLKRNPDVAILLLDIVMPGMDGIGLLRRMAAEGMRQRVIVLSAHDDYGLVREAFKAGADDYILKGDIDADSLLALLNAAARRIRESPVEEAGTVQLVREEVRAAREELLRALLRGRRPANQQTKLAALGLPASGPALLGLVWPDEPETAGGADRGASAELAASALVNTIRQVTERTGSELIDLSDDELAILLFPRSLERAETTLGEILEEVRSNARLYHNLNVNVQAGRAVDGIAALAAEYRRLRGYRVSTSRSVVSARAYIMERYADPKLSLTLLSGRLGVSRNYLSSMFRKETGATLTDYLTKCRIDAAKELLRSTDLKVYEICERVGYRSVEHFCRVFRRTTGRSPGSFGRRPEPLELE